MKILVVGPGAMGCLFAGLLSETGNDVIILDRNPRRAELINRRGIILEDGPTTRNIPVNIVSNPEIAENPDFACLFVKSFDTRSAIKYAMPAIGPGTNMVTLQNGIGNAGIIAEFTNPGRIICGVTSHGSTRLDDGHIRHAGRGPTFVAPLTQDNMQAAKTFAGILTKAGIGTTVTDNVTGMMWGKLIINAAINPLTAVSNVTNGELLERQELRTAMQAIVREAQQVATSTGVQLPYADAAEEAEKTCRATTENISSMLQDILNGRQTEIEAITGAIVREAHRLGISVPANEILLEAISKQTGQAQE